MPIEMSSDKIVCTKCGIAYSRRKGFFPTSYSELHKGVGFTHICRTCVEKLYNTYLAQCGDSRMAVRQMCRKLDLYWNNNIYESAIKSSSTRTIMTQYMIKVNSVTCAGKSYDDTLKEEGMLWSFGSSKNTNQHTIPENIVTTTESTSIADEPIVDTDVYTPTEDVILFWGYGYTPNMYKDLEQRRQYYMSRLPEGTELDVGGEALIRQICNIEIDIARDRVAGKSIDKNVNTLNTLLGSASLKPTQRKEDVDSSIANTPLGVWLYRYENERPLPEIDDELKDVNGLKKYIFTWMGHLCKMVGVKNGYTRMYEEEINRLRVEKPEYDDEEDETLLIDSYSEDKEFEWVSDE